MESKRKLLAAVGAQKQALDKEKEAKLTNLADVVAQINATLKLKKNYLQPLVKRLKQRRNESKQFEQEYLAKKGVYDKARIGYDDELHKVEQQIGSLQRVSNNLSTRYARMEAQFEIKKIRLSKAKME